MIAGLFGAAPALAVTIDFTKATPWSGVSGSSFEALGIRIESVGAGGGSLTFNPIPPDFGCPGGFGLACDGDGIGISDDEATGIPAGRELLRVTFLSGPVDILGVDVLDLFLDEGPGIDESVELSTDATTWSRYYSAGLPGGYVSTGFTASSTSVLYLRGFDDKVSDGALARITYVPEPATLSLLGIGVIGLAVIARRRRRH
jgi:hypothetical protein